jgi:hypothetical protein
MKKILFFILSVFMLASCQKDRDPVKVDYMITGFGDPYTVSYLDAEGKTITEKVTPKGISYRWVKSFEADPGTPLYLYAKSKEDISNSMGFSFGIIVDGKYMKQAVNYDRSIVIMGDTMWEIKRSGVIPF